MAQNMPFRFGPITLTTTTTTNLLNPGTTTGGTNCTSAPFDKLFIVLRHIRAMNQTTAAASFALWLGATGTNAVAAAWDFPGIATAGALTNGVSVSANNWLDWYGLVRISQADFLVGGAGTASAITLTGEGEIGVGA